MQGRQGQGDRRKDPLDRSATSGYRFSEENGKNWKTGETGAYRFAEEFAKSRRTGEMGAYRFSDFTGRQPVVPKRPPGMSPHLDQPPPTPRVARPRSEGPKRKSGKWWLGFLVFLILGGIVVGVVVYGATNFFFAASASLGPANTASDFLANLKSADYDQAYGDLGATVTVQLSKSDFSQMALADDHCYGQVTDYNEVSGSAFTSEDGNMQSFAYTITRSKMSKTYQLKLTLQKDATGSWSITSFGGDLGPSAPTCKS